MPRQRPRWGPNTGTFSHSLSLSLSLPHSVARGADERASFPWRAPPIAPVSASGKRLAEVAWCAKKNHAMARRVVDITGAPLMLRAAIFAWSKSKKVSKCIDDCHYRAHVSPWPKKHALFALPRQCEAAADMVKLKNRNVQDSLPAQKF